MSRPWPDGFAGDISSRNELPKRQPALWFPSLRMRTNTMKFTLEKRYNAAWRAEFVKPGHVPRGPFGSEGTKVWAFVRVSGSDSGPTRRAL